MKLPRVLRASRALQAKPMDDYVGVTGPKDGPTTSPFGSPHAPVTVGGDIGRVLHTTPRDTRSVAEVIADMVNKQGS
jgi:hypothetical protein